MKASTQAGAVTFVIEPPVEISRASSWSYSCRCIPDDGRLAITGHIDIQGEGEPNDLVLKVRLKLASGEDFKGEAEGLNWSERAGPYFYPLKFIQRGAFKREIKVDAPVDSVEVELVLWKTGTAAQYSLTRFGVEPASLPDESTFHWAASHLFPASPPAGAKALVVGALRNESQAATLAGLFPPAGRLWNKTSRIDRIEQLSSPLPGTGEYALITAAPDQDQWDWPLLNSGVLNDLLAEGGRVLVAMPLTVTGQNEAWEKRFIERFGSERPGFNDLQHGLALTPFRLLAAAPVAGSVDKGPRYMWLALARNGAFPAARRAMPELTNMILAGEWVRAAETIEETDRSSPEFLAASAWLRPLISNLAANSVRLEKAGEQEAAAMLRLAMHRLEPTVERYAYEAMAHLRVAGKFELARKIVAEGRQSMPDSLAVRLQDALLCAADGEPDRAIEMLWQEAQGLAVITPSLRRTMAVILRTYAQECQRAGIETRHPQPLLLPEVADAYNSDPERFAARWHATPFAQKLQEDAKARRAARKAAAPAVPVDRPIRMLVLTSDNWQFLVNLLDRVETHDTGFEVRTFDFAFLEQHWSKDHLHELFAPVSMGLKQEKVWKRATADDTTLRELVDWCDVVLCEWAGTHAIWMSRYLPANKRLIVRLHSFEAFSQWPFFIDFGGIDGMIFVADHIRRFTDLQYRLSGHDLATTVLPNFIPLENFARPKGPQAARTLAMVGYANLNKHPLMAAEILAALRKDDQQWKLRLYGHPWPPETLNETERAYHDRFWTFVREQKLETAIEIMPYTTDVASALQDVGFIVSCSWREGTHEAVLEGMATGCVPVLRRWPMVKQYGAPESGYPGIPCFDTVDEAVAIVKASAEPETFAKASSEATAYAMANFDIEAVFPKFTDFMRQVVSR